MGTKSAAVDAYIAKAAPFARPILEKIREAFHAGAPDLVETVKWGFPHFEHKGVLGSMAAFKAHVTWGFWKSSLMKDPTGLLKPMGEKTSMGGVSLRDTGDLPPKKVLVELVREAVRLNEEGIKLERAPRKAAAPLAVPDDLSKALSKNKKARETFDRLSPSQRRDYIEWVAEAKRDETRQKRLATTLEWLAEGKSRNWKYEK